MKGSGGWGEKEKKGQKGKEVKGKKREEKKSEHRDQLGKMRETKPNLMKA